MAAYDRHRQEAEAAANEAEAAGDFEQVVFNTQESAAVTEGLAARDETHSERVGRSLFGLSQDSDDESASFHITGPSASERYFQNIGVDPAAAGQVAEEQSQRGEEISPDDPNFGKGAGGYSEFDTNSDDTED
jgi:hypothetical protein